MLELLTSSLTQVFVVLIFCTLVWGILRIIRRKTDYKVSLFRFLGLHLHGFHWNKKFTLLFAGILGLAVSSTVFQYFFINEFFEITKSDNSPYWQILKTGFSYNSVALALVYCGLKAGLSEEILFRGLIAKRLISKFGYKNGNVAQAFIFWFLHFLLVGAMTKSWLSPMQLIVLLTIFPISLLFGFANEKLGGGSIIPSWILHASMNFATFLTLAFLF